MRTFLVSTWATTCGIAAHSQFLVEAMPAAVRREVTVLGTREAPVVADPAGIAVERVWDKRGASAFQEIALLARARGAELVHVEYQNGWFEPVDFAAGAASLHEAGIALVVTLHSIADVESDGSTAGGDWVAALSQASCLVVHRESDAARLVEFGVVAPIEVIEMGRLAFDDERAVDARRALGIHATPVLATYGFLLPHKGHLEIIEAMSLLKAEYSDVCFLAASALHPDPSSPWYLARCLERARDAGVADRVAITRRFINDRESMVLLHASDIVLMPYGPTSESASAAVSLALASRRPVVVTDQPIFDSLGDAVYRIPEGTPAAIVEAVRHLLSNPDECAALVECAQSEIDLHSWRNVAEQHLGLWRRLVDGEPPGARGPALQVDSCDNPSPKDNEEDS